MKNRRAWMLLIVSVGVVIAVVVAWTLWAHVNRPTIRGLRFGPGPMWIVAVRPPKLVPDGVTQYGVYMRVSGEIPEDAIPGGAGGTPVCVSVTGGGEDRAPVEAGQTIHVLTIHRPEGRSASSIKWILVYQMETRRPGQDAYLSIRSSSEPVGTGQGNFGQDSLAIIIPAEYGDITDFSRTTIYPRRAEDSAEWQDGTLDLGVWEVVTGRDIRIALEFELRPLPRYGSGG